MSVTIRLKRFGRRHRPFYRINAMDSRLARDSSPIEELGFYDPVEKDPAKAIQLNRERVQYWLSVGAQTSDTVRSLLKKSGMDPTNRSAPAPGMTPGMTPGLAPGVAPAAAQVAAG